MNEPMTSQESTLLDRCFEIATGRSQSALNAQEAGVFMVASMFISPWHQAEYKRLMKAAAQYFEEHPGSRTSSPEIFRQEWITDMGRFRSMLMGRLVVDRLASQKSAPRTSDPDEGDAGESRPGG